MNSHKLLAHPNTQAGYKILPVTPNETLLFEREEALQIDTHGNYSDTYQIGLCMKTKGLDSDLFIQCLQNEFAAYDNGHASFKRSNGEIKKYYHPDAIVPVVPTTTAKDFDTQTKAHMDLGTAPLGRIVTFTDTEGATHVSVNLHHIISDGFSAGLLYYNATQNYNAAISRVPFIPNASPVRGKSYGPSESKQSPQPRDLEKETLIKQALTHTRPHHENVVNSNVSPHSCFTQQLVLESELPGILTRKFPNKNWPSVLNAVSVLAIKIWYQDQGIDTGELAFRVPKANRILPTSKADTLRALMGYGDFDFSLDYKAIAQLKTSKPSETSITHIYDANKKNRRQYTCPTSLDKLCHEDKTINPPELMINIMTDTVVDIPMTGVTVSEFKISGAGGNWVGGGYGVKIYINWGVEADGIHLEVIGADRFIETNKQTRLNDIVKYVLLLALNNPNLTIEDVFQPNQMSGNQNLQIPTDINTQLNQALHREGDAIRFKQKVKTFAKIGAVTAGSGLAMLLLSDTISIKAK